MTLWTQASALLYGSGRGKADRQHHYHHYIPGFSRTDLASNALHYAQSCAETLRAYRELHGLQFLSSWCFQAAIDASYILLNDLSDDTSPWLTTVLEPMTSELSLSSFEECYRSILAGSMQRTMSRIAAQQIYQHGLTVSQSTRAYQHH